jgi:hypothetical protein
MRLVSKNKRGLYNASLSFKYTIWKYHLIIWQGQQEINTKRTIVESSELNHAETVRIKAIYKYEKIR